MTTQTPRKVDELASAAGDVLLRVEGDGSTLVKGLSYDSRAAARGDLFFCVPGSTTDGHLYADAAARAGASALCVQQALPISRPQIIVSDVRRAMARIAAKWWYHPARRLLMLGVTGTSGKTTSTYLLEAILNAAGRNPGLIGTIQTRVGGRSDSGVRTTPESVDLQRLLAGMVEAGADSVAMEVTSHGLTLHRVEAIKFNSAAFTNLSQDHLDFHSSMEEYFEAKMSLFVPERLERGAANVDDAYGRAVLESTSVPCVGFGMDASADVRAVDVHIGQHGSDFLVVGAGRDLKITTPLVGTFNVSNCLAAAATALQAGIDPGAIESGINSMTSVPGRFETVVRGQPFTVVVDYSHKPDPLDNVLRTARELVRADRGRVLVVFGCGGDRDRGKRPIMGGIAARLADYVVVTSDNPRTEEPLAIINAIVDGVVAERGSTVDHVDVDRRAAIHHALHVARPGDIVVIAGKGHETGQKFADLTIPFDDRDVAREVLADMGWSSS